MPTPPEPLVEEIVNTVSFTINSNADGVANVTFTEGDITITRDVNSTGITNDELTTRCEEVAWGVKAKIAAGVTPSVDTSIIEE
jgi:hypothetical protein